MFRSIAAAALLLVLFAGSVSARVFSPRVVSPHCADAYSMKTFRQFPRWKHLEEDQLAWEIYKYLVDTRTGLFHMNEVLEGDDTLSEYRTVRDPVKIINVYGYGYCGIMGPVMAGVCEGVGLGRARTLIMPNWHHVLSEVYYAGSWHYLDLDVRSVFRRADGSLASFEDAKHDASLWKGRGPLFFPNDPLESTRKVYARSPAYCHHGYYFSGHTMDLVLRQGETFTRWWQPQGGRWHHAACYHELPWMRKLIETPPRGPAPNNRHFTIHNYGNGRFIYQPDLTSHSTDFADGVYDAKNVEPTLEGLSVGEPGQGYVVFEVRSPYILVPKVGQLETTDDDKEASVVEIDSEGVRLAISIDNGLTWQDIAHNSGASEKLATSFDLTPYVSGTYGYLLKLVFPESAERPIVRSMKITTWVQVAPASLPALRAGKNRIDYRTGDHYGLPTRVKAICTEACHADKLLKYLVATPDDYDPTRKTSRVRGTMIAQMQAPPNTRIAWFSTCGSFQSYQRENAVKTHNSMAYALEKPEDFEQLDIGTVPTYQGHWHYNVAREVKLAKPAKAVFVRYVGKPGVNNFRIYAHCLEDRPRPSHGVVITHEWEEGDSVKSKRVEMKGPGSYELVLASEPTANRSIEMAVPSEQAKRPTLSNGSEGAKQKSILSKEKGSPPDWFEPMRKVHARFRGERGIFAQFGDSITDSRAFWFSLKYRRKNASPELAADYEVVSKYMLPDCWDRKGSRWGNESGQTFRWALKHVDTWLKTVNPEVAIVMFGSNDLNNINVAKYEAQMREFVQKCLANGTIVLLSTIPPRHGFEEKAVRFAEAARRVARDMKLPLIDLHAEIVRRRPNDWDGAISKFSEYRGYEVPTLIACDGVHPSNPKKFSCDYSPEALRTNGFALRNYLVLVKYAEVIKAVLK